MLSIWDFPLLIRHILADLLLFMSFFFKMQKEKNTKVPLYTGSTLGSLRGKKKITKKEKIKKKNQQTNEKALA